MATIQIRKPNDSRDFHSTEITSDSVDFRNYTIVYDRAKIDPIQAGITNYWQDIIRGKTYPYYNSFRGEFKHLIKIKDCPILLSREGSRYCINGQPYSLNNICAALARLTYKSCFEDDAGKLLLSLYNTLELPENVKYCLENRVPYHFYDLLVSTEPISVRMNCQQIDDNEIAIEISDGVWGTMTTTQLDVFCNFYRHGKKRGSWMNISPKKLYEKLMGRPCSSSDLKVMKEFLKQNRMQDIVEKRALELVDEILEQYPDRLKAEWTAMGELYTIFVKGKYYDWKLTNNKFKSDIQMVSTYVWQPEVVSVKDENEKGEEITVNEFTKPKWRGPICIDNMAKGSSLGDQFVARALALLNDSMTITIVNTIKRYLNAKPNEYRVDFNEM